MLIKDYYQFLITKKEMDYATAASAKKSKITREGRAEETYRPELAPKT